MGGIITELYMQVHFVYATITVDNIVPIRNASMEFWQVRDRQIAISLLAKIANFGKYVRLTVCMFVCLSVRINVVSGTPVTPLNRSSSNLIQTRILVMARSTGIF